MIARLLTLVLFCLSAPAAAAEVRIFAAASLKESLDTVARRFEQLSGHRVITVYAASSALARQIESGAPADVFISADLDWADYLDRKQLLAAATRINLLNNSLVLIAPAASTTTVKLAPGVNLAPLIGVSRIAMANAAVVPAGKYGKAALEALGAWDGIKSKIAGAENVRAALVLVSRGEAPLGIVYRTDALADKGVRIVDTFPAHTHPPITYPAALTASSKTPAARAFLAHLSTADTRAIWQRFGFTPAR